MMDKAYDPSVSKGSWGMKMVDRWWIDGGYGG